MDTMSVFPTHPMEMLPPLFVNSLDPDGPDDILATNDDGLRLQSISPAINAGSSISALLIDIIGFTRIDLPDLGAYEYISSCPEYLTLTGNIISTQKANISISTGIPNTINSGSSLTYQAGNFIQLNPGFSTGVNSVFVIKLIGGCQ